MACSDDDSTNKRICCKTPGINYFLIRLVDTEGNWIKGIEEKEMKLLVADSQFNILDLQPKKYDPVSGEWIENYLWGIKKFYNYAGTGEEEFIGGKKELVFIEVGAYFDNIANHFRDGISIETYLSYFDITYSDYYIVLQIDEKTSLKIQLFYKEFFNHGICIEKIICNGKEYISLESVPYYRNGMYVKGARGPKTNDIVIE